MMMIGHKLDQYLQTVQAFDWEVNNCCQYAMGWLQFRASPDYAPGYERMSKFEALRMARQAGGLERLVSHFLSREPVPVTQLQIGDLLLTPTAEGGESLAILAGRTAAVLTPTGVGHDQLLASFIGWKIK